MPTRPICIWWNFPSGLTSVLYDLASLDHPLTAESSKQIIHQKRMKAMNARGMMSQMGGVMGVEES
jgi:hypothetical protein